ncbi:MAG: TorF family putative porin [Minwuia sp.]|nr:TorF family putative porin [Minwuia sp.]
MFKKTLLVASIAGMAILGSQATAWAGSHSEDESFEFPGAFSGNVSLGSEYRFRGVTQSDKEPTIQGGFDWGHDSGVYLGTWASNVEFNDAHIEMDFYGGFTNEVGALSYDVGAIYYWYPGASDRFNFNFVEGYVGLGYDLDFAALSIGAAYSPEFFGQTGNAVYTNAGVGVPLPGDFSLDAGVGYQVVEQATNIVDWSVGVSKSFMGFDFSLSYVDTDQTAVGSEATVVFAVSRSF